MCTLELTVREVKCEKMCRDAHASTVGKYVHEHAAWVSTCPLTHASVLGSIVSQLSVGAPFSLFETYSSFMIRG